MRILLVCGCGISTTILAKKLKTENSMLEIKISTATDIKTNLDGSDVILLAPQVSYIYNDLLAITKIPIVLIDPNNFKTMNAKAILDEILNAN